MTVPRPTRPAPNPAGGDTRVPTAALVSDSRKVAFWTVVSRVTGFGRIATIAAVLGPTYFGNLFQTSMLLPNTILAMLGGSLIGSLLVPPLVRWRDQGDAKAVSRIAGGFAGALMLALSIVVLVVVVAAPLMLSMMTAAVADAEIRRQQQLVGWPLLAMLMPQILCYGIAATAAAVQNAHGRFALAAAAPVVENMGIMAVMVASVFIFGHVIDSEDVTLSHLLLLGLGTTASTAAHAAVQWWGAWQVGVPLRPLAGWGDRDVRRTIRLALTSSGYSALNGAIYFALLVVAGSIPGGAVAFQVGISFFFLPVAVGAVPLAAAQLPHLARSHSTGDVAEFALIYRQSFALAMFIAIPCALLFIGMPNALASAVAFGGMATEAGLVLLSTCVASLALATIGEAGFALATSASYARGDAKSPLRAMIIRAAIVAVGVVVSLSLIDGVAVLWALGLSFSVASLVSTACLRRWLTRSMPRPSRPEWHWLFPQLAISLVAVGVGVALSDVLVVAGGGPVHVYEIVTLVAALCGSGMVYLALQWMFGSVELRLLVSGLHVQAPETARLES